MELLVSMAVLVIVVSAFTIFFGWNFTSIFSDGEKSKATAAAETKLENLYFLLSKEGYDYESDPDYVSVSDLFNYQTREINFYIEEELDASGKIKGHQITVVAFYWNGERHVTIKSFKENVPEGGT